MRYGKTYYQIVAVISDVKKSNPENPTVWVLSERMRRKVEEVANLMQVKINIVIVNG